MPSTHSDRPPAMTLLRSSIQEKLVLGHVEFTDRAERAEAALAARLDPRDERGDVAPRTIGIAVMAGVAVAVGAIIKKKIEGKANKLSLE